MKSIISICITLFFTFVCACERVEENYLSENVEYAAAQYDLLIEKLGKNGKPWAPRTVDTKGNIVYAITYGTGLRAFSREAFGICIILREMRNGKHWRKSIRKL